MLRRLCVVACLAASAARAAPSGDETLRWVVQDLPPHFSYVAGRPPRTAAELGHGEVDGFLRLLVARLPGYRHEFVDASTARFEAMTRGGETLCSVLHVRTPERLRWLYFSHLYPPLVSREIHVVVRRELAAELHATAGQRLVLAELLQRTDLRPLFARDRSFGPQVDAVLARQPVPRLAVGSQGSRLLDMLRAGRMDYTLEYPAVVHGHLQRIGAAGALVALPLAEGLSTRVATVACSRNDAGRRRIEAIDAAVRALAQEPRREAWIREWRGEALDAADLKRINAYMDERARGGPRIE